MVQRQFHRAPTILPERVTQHKSHLRLTNNLVTQAQTYVIRTGLAEEFPEYKKYLDGSYKQEEEEEKKRKQEESL